MTVPRSFAFEKGTINTMLASPDGQSLYCTAAGSIWVQPSAGGPSTRMRGGCAVAMDPAGKYMAVVDTYQGRTRLLEVPFGGGPEQEIPLSGNFRPAPVASGAISKDGQLLLGLQSPDSWFIEPSAIDLATGRATRVPIDSPGDNFHLAWTADGQVMAAAQAARLLPFPFVLTARASNFLYPNPSLDDTINRLQAFERAGADVLFVPGLPDLAAVGAVCAAVSKPVDFMVGIKGKSFPWLNS